MLMTALERLQQTGIRRVRAGKGFTFRTAGAGRCPPRSWRGSASSPSPRPGPRCHVAPSATAKLQAVGKDRAGRWQYRYHPRFRERQERRKFQKLVDFADALPRMRKRVARDIRARGLGRDKVLACAIRVLSTCFMRPGSDAYARRHRHYGLTTILHRHVTVKGDLVSFDYPGKSGQQQHREIRDRSVARIVRQMLKLPGKELFKFVADDGAVVDVKREHLNDYIKGVMGPDFTAKDFRTWAGTLICACALARVVEEEPGVHRGRAEERGAEEGGGGGEGDRCGAGEHAGGLQEQLHRAERAQQLREGRGGREVLREGRGAGRSTPKPTLAEPEKALKELLEASAEPG